VRRDPVERARDEAEETGLAAVATIIGTVELARAVRERRPASLRAAAAAAEAPLRDTLLGADVAVIEAEDGALLALAEPTTEGRLAASLARHGEGAVGRYAALADGDSLEAYRRRAAAAGIALSAVADGPFGRSVLVLTRPVTGPHLIVVERGSLPSGR
jgi:hypothetical protein